MFLKTAFYFLFLFKFFLKPGGNPLPAAARHDVDDLSRQLQNAAIDPVIDGEGAIGGVGVINNEHFDPPNQPDDNNP